MTIPDENENHVTYYILSPAQKWWLQLCNSASIEILLTIHLELQIPESEEETSVQKKISALQRAIGPNKRTACYSQHPLRSFISPSAPLVQNPCT